MVLESDWKRLILLEEFDFKVGLTLCRGRP